MKKFLTDNFTIIVLIISIVSLIRSCGDSTEIKKMKRELSFFKDSTVTKRQFEIELKVSGLEAEKRMIQATDRKLLDVQRQTQIEEEIKKLRSK